MSISTRIQKLESGTEIMLFELDDSGFGAEVLRFRGHAIPRTPQELAATGVDADQLPVKSVWWQGQECSTWSVQISGIGANDNGTVVRPKFSTGNITGSITAPCLAFDNLTNFQFTIRETLAEYLNAKNFPDGNPDADPTQESISVQYVDQKSAEDNRAVTWDLANPGDVGSEAVGRQVTTLCHWCMIGGHHGPDCNYTDPCFDIDDNPADNPAKDQCTGLYRSCNRCWGQGNQLPFGGFLTVSIIARS